MDEILKNISSEFGLLGMLFVLSLGLNGILFKLLISEKDKRIEDNKEVVDGISSPLNFIKDSLQLIDQKVRISKKAEREDV